MPWPRPPATGQGPSANVLTPEEINPVASEVDNLRQRLETDVRNLVDEENSTFLASGTTVTHTETLAWLSGRRPPRPSRSGRLDRRARK